MTTRVLGMLEQVQALKEYLEENAEALSDIQARQLQEAVDQCWAIACRRKKERIS